ncbi:MAG: HD-GYP domain-containing protein [Armatimonadetes bacterium]|nr:HD-GYP domain-containing protein [Armatimonadota bacterium]
MKKVRINVDETFFWLVSVAGLLILYRVSTSLPDSSAYWAIAGFALFAFVAEFFLIRLPVGRAYASSLWISVSTPLVCTAAALYGMAAGIYVDAFTTVIAGLLNTWLKQTKPRWVLFNVGQSVLSASACGLAFSAIQPQRFSFDLISVAALIAALASYVAVNVSLVSIMMSLMHRLPLRWLREKIGPSILTQAVAMLPLALLVAAATLFYGAFGLFAILAPYFAVRHALLAFDRQFAVHRQTIRSLGLIIQRAHPYTSGHLQRAAELGRATAERLGMPPHRSELVYDAALLHDLGKIVLDERVLNKPGKLTEEEFRQVQKHPSLGAEILREAPFLDTIVPWVLYHHERPDGRGYPAGLKGDEIPIEASIISVVDAFDAMVGGETPDERRTYRQPRSMDDALAELRRCSGAQFNEDVVDVFEKVVRESSTASG